MFGWMALECMALPVAHTGGTHSYTYIYVCVCVYRGHALKPAELFRRLLYLPHATRGVRSPCNTGGSVMHACIIGQVSMHTSSQSFYCVHGPPTPTSLMAQWIRRLPTEQEIQGSNPCKTSLLRHRITVSTTRCGRVNPGSIPGVCNAFCIGTNEARH